MFATRATAHGWRERMNYPLVTVTTFVGSVIHILLIHQSPLYCHSTGIQVKPLVTIAWYSRHCDLNSKLEEYIASLLS